MVDLLVRYSNHKDELKHLAKLLRHIENHDQDAELVARRPEPMPLRGLARLSPDDMRQLITNFRTGTPKHVLAHRYGVSLSTVKRLLRRHREPIWED